MPASVKIYLDGELLALFVPNNGIGTIIAIKLLTIKV